MKRIIKSSTDDYELEKQLISELRHANIDLSDADDIFYELQRAWDYDDEEAENLVERIMDYLEALPKDDIVSEIQKGDFVDFGPYGNFYVCNPDYSERYFWITDEVSERFNEYARGWSMPKDRAEGILEDDTSIEWED